MSDIVRLTLRTVLDQSIEIDGLTPDRLARLEEAEIAALPVVVGSRRAAVGDFFAVHGARAERVQVEGDLRNVHGLGAGTAGGEMLIDGRAGSRVGANMTAGWIDVRGDAGDEAGLAMQGGSLRITGDAGDRLGAASAGASKGMTGGEIVVNGSAGSEVGARLRRGLISVGGDVGPHAARAIIAGTLVVFGRTGAEPGRGSKRGSIVALGPIDIPSTYQYACTYQPTYVRLLLTYLYRRFGSQLPDGSLEGSYARYCGDAGLPGRGEILAYTPDNGYRSG
jgi:formylmethanofuran dehydrogenase subunit C